MASKFNSDAPLQKRLLLYFIVVLSSIGLLLWQWPQARFDASVLSMLPSHSVKALPQELEDGLLERLDRQVILVLGGTSVTAAHASEKFEKYCKEIKSSVHFV